jgi:hypothetical protein
VCCDFFGLNHYNILNGASNAMEMITFFTEALAKKKMRWGTPCLIVVMSLSWTTVVFTMKDKENVY